MARRVPAEDFVISFQAAESKRAVAEDLGLTYGAVVSREKNLRKAGVNLKEMPRQTRSNGLSHEVVGGLNDLIDRIG